MGKKSASKVRQVAQNFANDLLTKPVNIGNELTSILNQIKKKKKTEKKPRTSSPRSSATSSPRTLSPSASASNTISPLRSHWVTVTRV